MISGAELYIEGGSPVIFVAWMDLGSFGIGSASGPWHAHGHAHTHAAFGSFFRAVKVAFSCGGLQQLAHPHGYGWTWIVVGELVVERRSRAHYLTSMARLCAKYKLKVVSFAVSSTSFRPPWACTCSPAAAEWDTDPTRPGSTSVGQLAMAFAVRL